MNLYETAFCGKEKKGGSVSLENESLICHLQV